MSSLPFCLRLLILVQATLALASAGTVVTIGEIREFQGPDDLELDPNRMVVAIDVFGDSNRTVNGVLFRTDRTPPAGVSVTAANSINDWASRPSYSGGTPGSADNLEQIMQDIRWEQAPAPLTISVGGLTSGTAYELQMLFNEGGDRNRRWDISIEGQLAVDDFSSEGEGVWSPTNGFAYIAPFSLAPGDTTLNVVLQAHLGGQPAQGTDNNPILQAFTVTEVTIPPAPDDIALAPTQFFPTQSAFIGNFAVTDGKSNATHTLALVAGPGDTDNAKFSVSGGQLLPSPFNFTAQAPGTVYSIRARATDAADGARFLEEVFTVSLAAPAAPTDVFLDASSLGSGLVAGQLAALISAADPNAFDRHTFALVPGAGSTDNALFTVSGNELRLASALPPGTASVTVRLRATDLSGLAVESSTTLPVVEPRVRINEVLAVSVPASLPRDENGQPQDWIELYNELPQPVNLEGWLLSDDTDLPAKWMFPAGSSIPPNGYFLVFASGSGATPAGRPPHANFSLSQSGEHLVLSRPDGTVTSDFNPPEQFPNTTWGVRGGGTELGYLRAPTPAALNAQLAAAGRNDVTFSVPHGFKTAAFPLALTATIPGSTIRYTLDGSVPTAASPVYSTPLNITPVAGTTKSGTRIVRAIATHADAAYTPVATQSHLFVRGLAAPATDGVVGQSNFFASIRNHATYGPLLDDALLALPAVSLVINGATDLPYAETESSMELFDPAGGEPGFTIPAGIIRSGTTSLNYAKGSMSARFRGEYGATRLNYPVYGNHPHDALGAVSEFQELRLRSCSHDTHSWLGTAENPPVPYGSPSVTRSGDAQLVRNIWIEDLQLLMGQPGKHGRLVNMFVNGNYYGIYHIQEHADDDYMGTYYPGGSEDYHFTGAATTGSTHGTESWSSVWAQLKASLGNYTEAKRWVDVANLADYMILSFYAGNDWDWSAQHNWGAAGPRLPDWGGWKFFQQDQDISLQDVNANCTDGQVPQGVPDNVFGALMAHADFKVLFRDRVYRHLFHDGVLTPARAAGFYDLRAGEITTAIVAETARWQPGSSVGALPWDRDGEWTVERNYLMNTYFPQRTAIQMQHFRSRGWYPVEAPEMSQHGGAVPAGAQVTLTGPADATLYYTLDGSDPRLPGGAISPTALVYSASTMQQILVAPNDDIPGQGAVWKYRVGATDPGAAWKTPGYDATAWPEGAAELGYGEGDEATDVGFVDADPVTSGIQKNITTYFRHTFQIADPAAFSGLNLRVKRDDGAVVYLNGQEVFRTSMPAGPIGFTTPGTAAADDGKSWFSTALTPAQFSLSAGANVLAVEVHNQNDTSSDISFDLELSGTIPVTPQPLFINEPTTLRTRARTGAEWSAVNEASFYLTGTESASTANLTLTEIHYNPEGDNQGDAEFLEFRNTGASAVNVAGVQIGGAVVFTFPSGIVLLPGEHVVVAKDQMLFDARYRNASSPWYRSGIRLAGLFSGSLSNGGEEIVILAADNAPLCTFGYGDGGAWPGRADGSGSSLELGDPAAAPATLPEKEAYLNTAGNWRPSSEFHGSPGDAGSGPDTRVVINEVLSASLAPNVDFIELLNISGAPQSVGGWFLSDSSADYRKFRIPAGTSLPDGAYLVFDESQFNNPAHPSSLVPFGLSSAGDDVFLLEADSGGNLLRFADRVEFASAPGDMTYGRSPNGTGSFDLARSPTSGAANSLALPQYADWVAAEFPPGTPAADTALAADPDNDGLDNFSEFAFKLAPLVPGGSPLSVTPADNGSPLQITFALRNDVPGLIARIDLSPDLTAWDTSEADIERLSPVPQPDGTDVITARLQADPVPGRSFLRVTLLL